MKILAKTDIETELKVHKAAEEIRQKPENVIDHETALVWAARAIAAYNLVKREASLYQRVLRFSEAEDYRREALEHAGTSGNTRTYLRIKRETTAARRAALRLFKTP